jgi:hypothetical protein
MPSDLECYVYVVPPRSTEFVTAGRFSQSRDRQDQPVGTFVYGRRYRERPDAVELDPVQLRLRQGPFETARLGGFFGALRDALPNQWGRRVIARHGGLVDRSPSRWANRRAILAGAGRFLLKPAEAEAIATRIFDAVASSWEATLREASVSPDDCQRLSRAFLYPGLELDPDVEG